jgi:adenylate cyclase
MIYQNYTNRLHHIVAESRLLENNLIKGFDQFEGIGAGAISVEKRKKLIQEQRDFSSQIQLNTSSLSNFFNNAQLKEAKLGLHPDFVRIKGTNDMEYHYIVSVFIDIQGSTNLHKGYHLEDIYRITNTIQSAAIHTCIALGGHIQRLQGDGVFAYFGGKNIEKNKAVELAVTACSMFTYFVENDLTDLFQEDGIENIHTRIGIDFGDDDDVQWANFGLMEVSELTTNSLHTSLASKMQNYSRRNGIVVGQYIKDRLNIDTEIFDLVRNSQGEVTKRYIFEIPEKGFRYTQYSFNWLRFLKTLPFVGTALDGKLYILDVAEIERVKRLKGKNHLLKTNTAYLSHAGEITSDNSGVKHENHRFHYGK